MTGQLSSIKVQRRKSTYLGMHSVLDVEHFDWIFFFEKKIMVDSFEK